MNVSAAFGTFTTATAAAATRAAVNVQNSGPQQRDDDFLTTLPADAPKGFPLRVLPRVLTIGD